MESDGTVRSWFEERMTEDVERASGGGNQEVGLMEERRSQSGKVEKWCEDRYRIEVHAATLVDGGKPD